jgi:hypothetical protein
LFLLFTRSNSVYPDGKVCISILHPPGEDQFNELVEQDLLLPSSSSLNSLSSSPHRQEKAEERWRPILSVEAIIVSVVSMLSNPNDESPANIDAAVRHPPLSDLPLSVSDSLSLSLVRSSGGTRGKCSIEMFARLSEEAKTSLVRPGWGRVGGEGGGDGF